MVQSGWNESTHTYRFGTLGALYVIFSLLFTTGTLIALLILGVMGTVK